MLKVEGVVGLGFFNIYIMLVPCHSGAVAGYVLAFQVFTIHTVVEGGGIS